MSISSVGRQGEVDIGFNVPMIVPESIDEVDYSRYMRLIITSTSDFSQMVGTYVKAIETIEEETDEELVDVPPAEVRNLE